MGRPRIKTALVGAFVGIGFIVGGLSTYSLTEMGLINKHVLALAQDWLPSVELTKEMDTALSDIRLSYASHITASTDADQAEAEKLIVSERERFLKVMGQYETLVSEDNERNMLAQIRADLESYVLVGNGMLEASRKDDDATAKKLMSVDMAPFSRDIASRLNDLTDINVAGARAAFEKSQTAYVATFWTTIVVVLGCLVGVAGATWFALAGVARPLDRITSAIRRLSAGDHASAIPYSGRTDEIGEIAASVEVFRANAIAKLRLEAEGVAQRDQAETARRESQLVERERAEAMVKATSGLGQGLKHLAAGDLTFQLNEPFARDFEELRKDFNHSVQQLAKTLISVTTSAVTIDNGTREIGQSADDLAKRTEQQAASLEETAAALDQITVNVGNSTKRADEARVVAIEANASAVRSGAVVANAVQAMERIENSSAQISNIISVIDEIAFQTNLLALNAGIEAARAGEAGKGFAVVAQEVRELAQRSANAAEEIKQLIQASASEVASGVDLVKQTGEVLKTIEAYVATINSHMNAIATSAKEQSVGLSEVNTAVNQMDQVTQKNAAMVEEANAASASLAHESANLRDLVSHFKLGVGAPVPAASRPSRSGRPKQHYPVSGNAALKSEWEEF